MQEKIARPLTDAACAQPVVTFYKSISHLGEALVTLSRWERKPKEMTRRQIREALLSDVQSGNTGAVKILLCSGADANAHRHDSVSVLAIALLNDLNELAKALIEVVRMAMRWQRWRRRLLLLLLYCC